VEEDEMALPVVLSVVVLSIVEQLMHQLWLDTKDILCSVLEDWMPNIVNEICDCKTMLKVVNLVQVH
jgi:hypothetical protein